MIKIIRSPRFRWFIFGCIVASMFQVSFSPNENKDYEIHQVKCVIKTDTIRAWIFMTDTIINSISICKQK